MSCSNSSSVSGLAKKPRRGFTLMLPSDTRLISASRSGVRLTPISAARWTSLMRTPGGTRLSTTRWRMAAAMDSLRFGRVTAGPDCILYTVDQVAQGINGPPRVSRHRLGPSPRRPGRRRMWPLGPSLPTWMRHRPPGKFSVEGETGFEDIHDHGGGAGGARDRGAGEGPAAAIHGRREAAGAARSGPLHEVRRGERPAAA